MLLATLLSIVAGYAVNVTSPWVGAQLARIIKPLRGRKERRAAVKDRLYDYLRKHEAQYVAYIVRQSAYAIGFGVLFIGSFVGASVVLWSGEFDLEDRVQEVAQTVLMAIFAALSFSHLRMVRQAIVAFSQNGEDDPGADVLALFDANF
ncbi:hypothetical protein HDA40_004176 [Hamadaea flava]|uniref:DUF2721 domain-containing protein n=1 Tax=Hamadaea flava TaxID=1742688 RepID=A0ABV8LIU5_9ACTN|nr:hypothetical protein [Hamadaea flava]MCP2325669.1 hypothetical protein [Hamadaea flava]